jgi:uncharacterized protein involved in high-affinity Fe2+ transport
MSVRRGRVVLPVLLAALAACRPGEAPDLERLDPHGVPGAIATAEADPAYFQPPDVLRTGDRICAANDRVLVAAGIIVVHADANMHRVGECFEPRLPLFAHERDRDRDRADQSLYIQVNENRYLPVQAADEPAR